MCFLAFFPQWLYNEWDTYKKYNINLWFTLLSDFYHLGKSEWRFQEPGGIFHIFAGNTKMIMFMGNHLLLYQFIFVYSSSVVRKPLSHEIKVLEAFPISWGSKYLISTCCYHSPELFLFIKAKYSEGVTKQYIKSGEGLGEDISLPSLSDKPPRFGTNRTFLNLSCCKGRENFFF